ncbi:MAG: NHL repeat-containing protein [Planctomycetes bacterium]|nr:NHL repeat-containing protein [Planctomycetota bacterium]
MAGGVAVRANLLCVTWSAARGHVFLFDLEAARPMSAWTLPGDARGYSDAAGVAMDEHFHLFVADPRNDRVRHFSAFGRHLGDLGLPPPAQGDAARDRPGVLDRPHGVAIAGDTVYVACGDRPRRRGVQRFTRHGELLRPLASQGDGEASFGAPRAVWADAEGVLVADTLHGCIQRFRLDGTYVNSLRYARAGVLARPVAVARQAGVVWILDAGDEPGLLRREPDGGLLAAAADAGIVDPVALAADEGGRVHLLDHGGERVVRLDAAGGVEAVVVDLREHLDDFPQRG